MPLRPPRPCTTPGCDLMATRGRCEDCQRRGNRSRDLRRGTAGQRGYGGIWRARRLDYLLRYRWCTCCGQVATVADHYPVSRRALVALGVEDPDADEHLRPLCDPCHRTETARHQPGGWYRSGREQ